MKKKILICGAGGFIGGHLASKLIKENEFDIICADIKPKEYWFQILVQCNLPCMLVQHLHQQ